MSPSASKAFCHIKIILQFLLTSFHSFKMLQDDFLINATKSIFFYTCNQTIINPRVSHLVAQALFNSLH